MPLVDILCLANSNKVGGRCIAGLRVDGGGWVRLVAPETSHGQLYFRHYKLDDGSEPAVLDVIAVDLAAPQPMPGHPENWVIGRQPWILRERPAGANLRPLWRKALHRGSLLFGSTDRTVESAAAVTQSFALVAPAMTRWALGPRKDGSVQPRVLFRLGGKLHNLAVTDPAWISRILRSLGAMEAGWYKSEVIGIPAAQKTWLTVSLSEPYEGERYKLVTAVIGPPVRKPAISASRTQSASAIRARL
jgi:hypothetical protein